MPTDPVLALLQRHGFDVQAAAAGADLGLMVEHPDSDDRHRLAPLVAVSEAGRTRVAVAHFAGDGELRPGLSVALDASGRPVSGTDSFAQPLGPQTAHARVADAVRQTYARSTDAQPF